jgi:indolepyruvate ferredoxin oxidoreductase beta subunit
MKLDIILAGVGGQGILSIATVLGYAAVESGLRLKQAEVHGMSQRGGDVQSHLRISDREIYSDLIPEGDADIILSVEPMESLRYLPFLSPEGWLVTNTTPYKNIPNYPDLEKIMEEIGTLPHHVAIDADGIAKELKNPLGMNMVMTGGSSLFMDIDFEMLKKGVRYIFGRKGDEVVEKNIATLEAGRKYAEEHRSS